MVKRLLLALLLCAVPAFSQTATVSGTLQLPSGSPATNSYAEFQLVYCGGNEGRVVGTSTIVSYQPFDVHTNATGFFTTPLYGNNQITCGVHLGISRWRVTHFRNGAAGPSYTYQIQGGSTVNLDTVPACAGGITTNCVSDLRPVVPPLPPVQGAPGTPGAPGAAGATGATGATGAAGATGSPGAAGSPGSTGATGATGAAGATGAPGNALPKNWHGLTFFNGQAPNTTTSAYADNSAINVFGTQTLISATATEPTGLQGTTGPASDIGAASGFTQSAAGITLGTLQFFRARVQISDLTNSRYWIVLSNAGTGNGNLHTDTPEPFMALGFRLSAGVDAFWTCYATDGFGHSTVLTTTAGDTTASHLFDIKNVGGAYQFFIDGLQVCSLSTQLPPLASALKWSIEVDNKSTANDRNFILYQLYWETP
jgi:hypothetical protein